MSTTVEFWFELASSYSYPAAMRIEATAQAEPLKQRVRANTERATALGLFGAPSFRVGEELFWGSDRLDEALAWAQGRHPLQR